MERVAMRSTKLLSAPGCFARAAISDVFKMTGGTPSLPF